MYLLACSLFSDSLYIPPAIPKALFASNFWVFYSTVISHSQFSPRHPPFSVGPYTYPDTRSHCLHHNVLLKFQLLFLSVSFPG